MWTKNITKVFKCIFTELAFSRVAVQFKLLKSMKNLPNMFSVRFGIIRILYYFDLKFMGGYA